MTELHRSRNAGPGWHRFGMLLGSAHALVDSWFKGLPYTLNDPAPDHAVLKPAAAAPTIDYPKPDGVISFDKLSSVFLSNTNHEEDQPCHLQLGEPGHPHPAQPPPISTNPPSATAPRVSTRCSRENGEARFRINAQNCVHCKTCDIKDPAQNITWVVPEGAGPVPTIPICDGARLR